MHETYCSRPHYNFHFQNIHTVSQKVLHQTISITLLILNGFFGNSFNGTFCRKFAKTLPLKIPSHPKRVVIHCLAKNHFRKLHQSKHSIDMWYLRPRQPKSSGLSPSSSMCRLGIWHHSVSGTRDRNLRWFTAVCVTGLAAMEARWIRPVDFRPKPGGGRPTWKTRIGNYKVE